MKPATLNSNYRPWKFSKSERTKIENFLAMEFLTADLICHESRVYLLKDAYTTDLCKKWNKAEKKIVFVVGTDLLFEGMQYNKSPDRRVCTDYEFPDLQSALHCFIALCLIAKKVEAKEHNTELMIQRFQQNKQLGEVPGYSHLWTALMLAYDQATRGKGKQRHANDLPFQDQPMQTISDHLGSIQGMLFQAHKKSKEAMQFPVGQACEEIAGAIVYLAGAIVWLRRHRDQIGEANDG